MKEIKKNPCVKHQIKVKILLFVGPVNLIHYLCVTLAYQESNPKLI